MPSEFFLNPLEMFVIALLAGMAGIRWWPALGQLSLRATWPMVAAGFAITSYALIVIYYISSPAVFDHGEIMVPAWSWMFATGHPLYNKMEDAARYSTIYGPDGTIFFAWAMELLGPGMFACKIAAGFAGLGSCALAFAAYARQFDLRRAWFGTGLVCLLYLAFAFQSFMTKGDPFLFLFASLALWSFFATGPITAGILIALCMGIEINLKLHGPLYILPVFVLYWRQYGIKKAALLCTGAAIIAFLPYLYPQCSLVDWFEGFRYSGSEGFGRSEFLANVQWFGFLWLPFPALFFICSRRNPAAFDAAFRKHRLFLITLFIATLLTLFVGSKVGSGPAHFTPFVPLLVYAFCLFLDKEIFSARNQSTFPDQAAQACLAAFMAAAFFLAAHQQYRFLTAINTLNPNTEIVDADVADIIKAFSGKTICMGYGSNQTFFLSQQMLPLLFAGNPLYFDFSAMQSFHEKGLSPKGRDVISKKQVDVWLIPHGDQPFVIQSFYQPNPQLFDDAFRASFAENYQRIGSSRFFDLYQPKP
jgi:hypothetical protein